MLNDKKINELYKKFEEEEDPVIKYTELERKQLNRARIDYVGQLPKVDFLNGIIWPIYLNDLNEADYEDVFVRLENIANTYVREKVLNEYLRRAWLYYGQKTATWDDLRDFLRERNIAYQIEKNILFDEDGDKEEKYIRILYEEEGLTNEECDEWEFLTDFALHPIEKHYTFEITDDPDDYTDYDDEGEN